MARPKVELILNLAGFNGKDIDEIANGDLEFILDYSPIVGLTRQPCAVDSTYFTLTVVFTAVVTTISTGFFNKLGEDLYLWTKNTIQKVFSRKTDVPPNGFLEIKISNISFVFYPNSTEELLEALKALTEFDEKKLQTNSKKELEFDFNIEKNKWETAKSMFSG